MSVDRFNAMRAFAAVAHSGSFVGGAKRMRTSTSAVSRRIAELEKALGVRLLQRTTRRLQLTETGKHYLEGCERVLALLGDLESSVIDENRAPRGRLRIAAQLGPMPLMQTLAQFRREYPDVDLEFIRLNRPIDMLDEQFDLWVHAYGPLPSEHVTWRLMPLRLVIAASPDYLAKHGIPSHPRQLAKHICLVSNLTRESNPWGFEQKGETVTVKVPSHFISNDSETLIHMARAGAGIIRLPIDVLADDLQRGTLRLLLNGWTTQSSLHVRIVYPSALHLPFKVRTFLDLLKRNVKAMESRRPLPGQEPPST